MVHIIGLLCWYVGASFIGILMVFNGSSVHDPRHITAAIWKTHEMKMADPYGVHGPIVKAHG